MKKSPSNVLSEVMEGVWRNMANLQEDNSEICESQSKTFSDIGQAICEGLKEGIRVGKTRMEEYKAMLEWLGGEDSPEKRCVRRMIKRENDRNKNRYAIRAFFNKLLFWKKNDW